MRAVLATLLAASLVGVSVAKRPAGCECIGKKKALELLTSVETKHSVSSFGEDYGSYCAAWEDGACSASIDYNKCINGPGHTCGNKKGCHDLWPDYNFNTDQIWCCDSWCYVNATTCKEEDHEGLEVKKSWLNIDGLYYSYQACEDSISFPKAKIQDVYDAENAAVTLTSYAAYTQDTCPYKVQPTGCECIGSNDALGQYERDRHGQDYGKWCAAWEDGVIATGTANAVKALADGSHTGGGNLTTLGRGAGCNAHWPDSYDWTEPQAWCCDSWCYVDADKCNATKYGIDVAKSWTGKNLYYSYGACGDWVTKPTKPEKEAQGRAANFSKHTCATCPWAKHVVNAYGGKDRASNNNTYHVPQKESEATCLQDYGMKAKTTAPGRTCESFNVPDAASSLSAGAAAAQLAALATLGVVSVLV